MVSHTHWDREWYYSKERWSFRLARLFDELLDIIDNEPEYHSFWFDGQTIAIEDYLELRPENRERLETVLQSGKILIGPHYIQIDERLTGGEAIFKNLELGITDMERYGQSNLVGYLPDTFGHISQMPQILRQFNIDSAVFWRGYDNRDIAQMENRWQSPDGSEVTAICLVQGYSCASGLGKVQPYHGSMKHQCERIDHTFPVVVEYSGGNSVLMMNGIDHSLPTASLAKKLEKLADQFPGFKFRHGSLREYLAEARKTAANGALLTGELSYAPRLDATLSSRPPQKLLIRQSENTLINYAEPLQALAGTNLSGFLDRAWKLLLKNRFHDTVCGCHANEVARDFTTREERCIELAEGVTREAYNALTGRDPEMESVALPLYLSAFNPLPHSYKSMLNAVIEVPSDSDFVPASLRRGNREYPLQINSMAETRRRRFHRDINPTLENIKRYQVTAGPVEFDEGLGLATYAVCDKVEKALTTKLSLAISTTQVTISNQLITATIRQDGSMDIEHAGTGRKLENLNRLIKVSDSGDLYHSVPGSEKMFVTPGKLQVIENGPLQIAVRLYAAIDAMPVTFDFKLGADMDYVDVRFALENSKDDYRLSAEMPLTQDMSLVRAHTPFDFVTRRPIPFDGREKVIKGQIQRNCFCRDMQYLVAASSANDSLVLLNRGLYEFTYESPDMLTLTLFRVSGIINADLAMHDTSTGQCHGRYEVDYAIGLTGSNSAGELIRLGQQYNLPPCCRQFSENAPVESNAIKLSIPGAVFSSLQNNKIRLFNPNAFAVSGHLDIPESDNYINLTIQPGGIITINI